MRTGALCCVRTLALRAHAAAHGQQGLSRPCEAAEGRGGLVRGVCPHRRQRTKSPGQGNSPREGGAAADPVGRFTHLHCCFCCCCCHAPVHCCCQAGVGSRSASAPPSPTATVPCRSCGRPSWCPCFTAPGQTRRRRLCSGSSHTWAAAAGLESLASTQVGCGGHGEEARDVCQGRCVRRVSLTQGNIWQHPAAERV